VLLAVVFASSLAAQSKQPTTKEQIAFGIEMARRGLWSEALFRFQRAEKMDPRDPAVLNNMAVAYEALGLFEEALTYYRKALEVDSGNADLKRNYARFAEFYQVFRGDDEEAPSAEGGGDGANEDQTDGSGGSDADSGRT
jgi:Flp pilus assembly protein TadD